MSPHGGRAQVQTGSGEHLGDLDLAQRRAKGLESADEVAGQRGELVHRRGELDQGVRAFLVDAAEPRGDGGGGEEKLLGGLFQRPAAGRLEFQNGHAFGGRVERAAARVNPHHAGVLDADFFPEQLHLLL